MRFEIDKILRHFYGHQARTSRKGVLMLFWFDTTHLIDAHVWLQIRLLKGVKPQIFCQFRKIWSRYELGETEGIENGKVVKFWWTRW